jgi:hypothetical protein
MKSDHSDLKNRKANMATRKSHMCPPVFDVRSLSTGEEIQFFLFVLKDAFTLMVMHIKMTPI